MRPPSDGSTLVDLRRFDSIENCFSCGLFCLSLGQVFHHFFFALYDCDEPGSDVTQICEFPEMNGEYGSSVIACGGEERGAVKG